MAARKLRVHITSFNLGGKVRCRCGCHCELVTGLTRSHRHHTHHAQPPPDDFRVFMPSADYHMYACCPCEGRASMRRALGSSHRD